ncbi:carbohydrate ABC transporter permease [Paenibacillus thermotolerans]|uniref:carbohydrate ABC transporter permease n=1 Tax=Paenibacillus thermotolerans TaxID=3027807 RepID=UPI002367B5B4|nr:MULTISPECIES: carbohydrate ABC transporter permease [unclassified Paenibacillus]
MLKSSAHHLALLFLLALTLLPFYMLLISSLKYKDQMVHSFWRPAMPLHLDNYGEAFRQLWPFLGNSIVITSGIIACVLINSTLAAYAFARYSFHGKELLYYFVLLLMMVPSFLLLIPQFVLFKHLGLINTYWAQIFGPMAGASSTATMLIRAFFEDLSDAYMEAAEMEGAGDLTILTRIMLPLSLPILATVSIMNALLGWNNYIWPLVITSGDRVKPVILAISSVTGPLDQVQGIQFAGFVIASIPLLALFIASGKSFVEGFTAGAVKG